MGEHLGDEVFRIAEISVQHSGGTSACFVRHPKEHAAYLKEFFERTGHDYTRFNYLGEWHSHPSFEALPSRVDAHTMQSLVCDRTVGVNFLVLLIVRLAQRRKIEVTATAFRAGAPAIFVPVKADKEPGGRLRFVETAARWMRGWFSP
jgi:proteasome lid subunit RPN8/RPN11